MRSINNTLKTTRTPATAPMMVALKTDTTSTAVQIATIPAKNPFTVIPTSGFLNKTQTVNMAIIPPAAPAGRS